MTWLPRIVSLAGAVLAIVALFVPFAGDGLKILDVGSLFDSFDSFERQIVWALPPLASGIAGVLLPFVTRGRLLGGALVAIGVEAALYFVGYVLAVRQGIYGSDLATGGFLGIAGGAGMVAAGVLALMAPVARTTEQATAPSASPVRPPSGWYPDPSGQARERFWDGVQWTFETR